MIEVPEANGMPLERWTAYMYCQAIANGLCGNTFYLCTRNGMSTIVKKEWKN